jgi:Gas vesicle protein K/Gas vesicle protein
VARFEGTVAERVALVDAIDHLLNRGVVLVGQTTLSLAGVDLVYLGLNLLVSSVETLREHEPVPPGGPVPPRPEPHRAPEVANRPPPPAAAEVPLAPRLPPSPGPADASPAEVLAGLPARLEAEAGESPERGLARLVLTLVELLRQLLERQAVRRMEGGGLAAEEVERMGLALMELEAKMVELRAVFGLEEEDLNLDLGPLGDLL